MSCRKVGLLFPRSRSQQRVKISVFVQMISSKLTNILLPDLVLRCFADDIDGLAGEEEELANLVERLDKASTAYGMVS